MPATSPEPWNPSVSPHDVETVAERIQKLEQAIASLKNTEVMEEYVAERVLNRLTQIPADAPEGLTAAPHPFAMMNPDPNAAHAPTDLVSTILTQPASAAAKSVSGGLWSRIPILAELRLIFWMYFDARYRVSRFTQIAVPVVFGLMVLNYLLFTFWSIPVFDLVLSLVFPFIERGFLVILSIALYKILAREATRYEAVLKYLAKYGR